MKKLRKQINESFFNPVLHLLPLLLFLVLDDFFGMGIAWKVSFPVALILVVYVFYNYNRVLIWHLIFTFLYVIIIVIAGLEYQFPINPHLHKIFYEIVVMCFLLFFIAFKTQIHRVIFKIISKLTPMSNNFNELYRFIWALFLILTAYISSVLLVEFSFSKNTSHYLQLLQYAYLVALAFLIVYELVRVYIVRADLLKEEWWPIVSDQGKIIGSVQHQTSLNDENKYKHPVVRVLIIDKGLILMQKRSNENLVFPGLWDTAISNHMKMGENIDQCIDRTALERYGLNSFRYMYLSTYSLEVLNEYHYAFLFVSCQQMEIKPNLAFIDQTKWWTQQQIEQNLNAGIFTDNFVVEYDLLKRSGLLESSRCECDCRLKEAIYGNELKNLN